jgi:hypothetical protein
LPILILKTAGYTGQLDEDVLGLRVLFIRLDNLERETGIEPATSSLGT